VQWDTDVSPDPTAIHETLVGMDTKQYTKDEETGAHQVDVTELHPEYQEYLALNEVYQGDKLKKLTVRLMPVRQRGRASDTQRKVDWHVIPQLLLIYMLSYIDRANVGNARLFGAEADMGLSANDWNIGLTVFCERAQPQDGPS
jgi:hypothetical protein